MKKIFKVKKLLVAILLVALIASVSLPFTFAAPGDGPGQGQKGRFAGAVQNIDYTKKTFGLKAPDKEFVVNYTDDTFFIKDGKKVTPQDLKNEDKVMVSGPIADDGKTIDAHQVLWGTPPQQGQNNAPMIMGVISNLNIAETKFDLLTQDPNGKIMTFKVTFKTETRFVRDLKPSKPEEFKNDELVTILGKINIDEKTAEALAVIFGKMPEPPKKGGNDKKKPMVNSIIGKVGEIDLQNKQFTLILKNNDTITVKFQDWTNFIRNGNYVYPTELKKDVIVNVFGPVNKETKTIEAHNVIWGNTGKGRKDEDNLGIFNF